MAGILGASSDKTFKALILASLLSSIHEIIISLGEVGRFCCFSSIVVE
jgi:hypothetical protein